MVLSKTPRNLIILALLALSASGVFPIQADALIQTDYGSDSKHFALQYQKNQGQVTILRAVHPQELSVLKAQGKADNSVLFNAISYDVFLPSVNYEVKKPQAFQQYLEGKIKQESKELGYKALTLTPSQLSLLSLRVTRAMISYDNRMVRSSPTYSQKLDDRISTLSLDQVAMKEHIGVCRQYAALYAYVANHIVHTSGSPALKNVRVDEVISYDFNHAYTVLFNPGVDKGGSSVIEIAFIDPSAGVGKSSLTASDGLDASHDALFSEFIKSARWDWTTDEKESILKQLLVFRQQDEFSALQASAELVELYNNTVTAATINDVARTTTVGSIAHLAVAQNKVSKNQKSAYEKVAIRYRANLSYFEQMQSILQ